MIKIVILASGLGMLASAAKLHAAAILTNAPPVNGRLVISWSSRGTPGYTNLSGARPNLEIWIRQIA